MAEAGGGGAGRLIGDRYRLVERVGGGGSADVWRAVDERLGRTVALKVLHPHLVREPQFRERLAREARTVAALDHPSIVRVHDVVIDAETAAIALEFVAGESLADRVERAGPLDPREAATITAVLSDGLAAAHAQGLLHRDLTPVNVLLPASGGARLIDFGIARLLDDERDRLTSEGDAVGTWRWMAPEQLTGHVAGPATDLYGLGALLAFMLTGQAPEAFRSGAAEASVPAADRSAAVSGPAADRSAGLLAVARQCLDPDPSRRPSSATEVAAWLRGWLGGPLGIAPPRDTAGRPAPKPQRAVPVSPDAMTLPAGSAGGPPGGTRAPRPSEPRRRGRLRSVGRAAGLLAVLVLALVAAPLLDWRSGDPTTPTGTPVADAPAGSADPTPTPAPTPPPPGGRIVVLEPQDGVEVDAEEVVVSGLAPPGSTVVREFGFFETQSAEVGPDGSWRMRVRLDPGDNSLTFRVGDDPVTSRTIHVTRP